MNRPAEELIYDRTETDVLLQNLNGQYNASDLNRVESWCAYLEQELNKYGYDISLVTKTDWTSADLRDEVNMNRIRINIRAIMVAFTYLTSIEPNVDFFNWVKANNWEQILAEIEELLIGTKNNFVYSGVSRCGQPRIWQQRFRHRLLTIWTSLTQTYWSDFSVTDKWEDIIYEDNY